jgi:hypothetical protein
MRENFPPALTFTLGFEGGFADHPADPGGATMKGVTLSTFRRYKQGADSGPPWTWQRRPAGMYLIGFRWTLYIIVRPLLNLFLRLFGASAELQIIVDVAMRLDDDVGRFSKWVIVTLVGLFLGGVMVIDGLQKIWTWFYPRIP